MRRIKHALEALAQIPSILAHLAESAERLSQSIQEGRTEGAAIQTLSERLEALERERGTFLAEVEGLVTRAESKLSAARGAEERARGMVSRAEKLNAEAIERDEKSRDPFEIAAEQFQNGNDQGGAESGVQDVRTDLDVPLHGKHAAAAVKFGRL